jgi:hypothetical protein
VRLGSIFGTIESDPIEAVHPNCVSPASKRSGEVGEKKSLRRRAFGASFVQMYFSKAAHARSA